MDRPRRRLILEVRFGRETSRKLVVEAGQTVRIGRSEPADFVFARDPEMSGAHAELSWDGARCHLRDLGSAKGTSLGGARIDDAQVPHGGWLTLGTTNLMAYFEAPRRERPLGETQRRALERLRAEPLPLFAVIDAAHGLEPLTLLRASIDPHQSLYDGGRGEALALVAPYLVALRPDSELLERLVEDGWSKRWAIFLTSARPFVEVRRHLRRLLVVELEESGRKYLLRFYDPAILPTLLGSATPRQRQQIFGELGCFLFEGPDGELARVAPAGGG